FSPTGDELLVFNANSQQQVTLGATGTYVIQIRASDFVSTGSYTLGLRCQVQTSPVHAPRVCVSLLLGAIEAAAEVDQLTFSGQAYQCLSLTLARGRYPFPTRRSSDLFSPTGDELLVFNANSQQQVTLGATGTHVIQIRASNFVSTGSYSLGLECLVPTSPVDEPLVCGSLAPGAIGSAAEVGSEERRVGA